MDESTFWGRLEYRICDELAGLGRRDLRRLWCDGLIPELYLFDDPSPRVVGRAWMGVGNTCQEPWEFTLLLGRSSSREGIGWSGLLPPPGVTRWLTADPVAKCLVIEPGVAMPEAA